MHLSLNRIFECFVYTYVNTLIRVLIVPRLLHSLGTILLVQRHYTHFQIKGVYFLFSRMILLNSQ